MQRKGTMRYNQYIFTRKKMRNFILYIFLLSKSYLKVSSCTSHIITYDNMALRSHVGTTFVPILFEC